MQNFDTNNNFCHRCDQKKNLAEFLARGILGSYLFTSTERVIRFMCFWHQHGDPCCLKPGLTCILRNCFQSRPHQLISCIPIALFMLSKVIIFSSALPDSYWWEIFSVHNPIYWLLRSSSSSSLSAVTFLFLSLPLSSTYYLFIYLSVWIHKRWIKANWRVARTDFVNVSWVLGIMLLCSHKSYF